MTEVIIFNFPFTIIVKPLMEDLNMSCWAGLAKRLTITKQCVRGALAKYQTRDPSILCFLGVA